jgi:hypothetical protein
MARRSRSLFSRFCRVAFIFAAIQLCALARAELPWVRFDILTPLGGKLGSTVEISVQGDNLEDVRSLRSDDPGLKAEFVKQDNNNKAIFRLSIAPTTLVGTHDIHVIGRYGISNSRLFEVNDTLAEVDEKEPNETPDKAQIIPLNCVVNGSTDSQGDDYYRWKGTKGQQVVIDCLSSRLGIESDPSLTLFGPSGKQLASNRNYNGPDPLIAFKVPEDGDYVVMLNEATYNGGRSYRLKISTLPYLDGVFPLAVAPGQTAGLSLFGRNLPGATAEGDVDKLTASLEPRASEAADRLDFLLHPPSTAFASDTFQYRIPSPQGFSNPVTIGAAQAPTETEREPNDQTSSPQKVTLPCELQGRLDRPGDRDVYSIDLKAGQNVCLAAWCERAGSQGDLTLLVLDDQQKEVAEFDDSGQNYNQRFTPYNRDPEGRFNAPKAGTFRIQVSDRYQRGGPRFIYRLRISEPQPDYRAVVVHNTEQQPSALCVRQGGAQYYDLIVERRDGFDGEIAYRAEGLPPGVVCPPGVLGPNVNRVPVVFTASPDAPIGEAEIRVFTSATVAGKTVEREARSVVQTINNQQASRMARDIVMAVRPSAPYAITAAPSAPTVTRGGKLDVKVTLQRRWPQFKAPVQLSGLDLPNGFDLSSAPISGDATEVTLKLSINNGVRPGRYTIVVRSETQVPFTKEPDGKNPSDIRVTDPAPGFVVEVRAN